MNTEGNGSSAVLSVVMPAWNAAAWVREAIESILGQTLARFEFIIVDDGSTDATPDIVQSCRDSRLRFFRREHRGIVEALNFGIAQSVTPWIARQDADDISEPERLRLQWSAVQARASTVLCYTGTRTFGQRRAERRDRYLPRTKALLALHLCFRCPIAHNTALFRKEAFGRAGGYLPGERHAEDMGLWMRMLREGGTACIPRPLVRLRVHAASISHQAQQSQESVARPLAVRHAQELLGLSPAEAERACDLLRTPPSRRRISDWYRLVRVVRGRIPGAGLELWTWLASQSFRTLVAMDRPSRLDRRRNGASAAAEKP